MSDDRTQADVADALALARPDQADPMAERLRRNVRRAVVGVEDEPVRIGRFEVRRHVGSGGMGSVYAAFDPKLQREVAVKVLEGGGEAAQRRVLREARAIARVQHPNVIGVFDADTDGDTVYIAMELIDGYHLGEWLRQRRRSIGEILSAFSDAGRGLAAAHRAGLVHGDFKPENTLIDGEEHVRVVDFGLARTGESPSAAPPTEQTLALAETAMTHAGAGTPAYMAPEQLLGQAADARSDQFSFCVALYAALWGTRPFAGDTVPALIDAVTSGRLEVPPASGDVDDRVRAAVIRGLSRDPDERFESMDALLADLEPAAKTQSKAGARIAGVALGAAALIAAVIAIVLALQGTGESNRVNVAAPQPEPRVAVPAPDPAPTADIPATEPVAVIVDAGAAEEVEPKRVAVRSPRTTKAAPKAKIETAPKPTPKPLPPTPASATKATKAYCTGDWIDEANYDRALFVGCANIWLREIYGKNPTDEETQSLPKAGQAVAFKYTAAKMTKIYKQLLRICRDWQKCSVRTSRVLSYFMTEVDARRSLRDPIRHKSIAPLIVKALAGEKLTAAEISPARPWSALTLWKLEAAVKARHGMSLGHSDLTSFFYGNAAAKGESAGLPVARKKPATKLEAVDKANLALIRKHR